MSTKKIIYLIRLNYRYLWKPDLFIRWSSASKCIFNDFNNSILQAKLNLNQQTRYFSRKQDYTKINPKQSASKTDYSDLSRLNEENDPEQKKKKHRGKTPEVAKVYLRDDKGRLLGLMTRTEAEQLAIKHKKHLIIDPDGQTKKIPTVKFSDPKFDKTEPISQEEQDLIQSGDGQDECQDDQTARRHKTSPKMISMTSKVSPHDLQVKINQVKKFLLKGQETIVRVNSMESSTTTSSATKKLEKIFERFDQLFKEQNGVRINQKRLSERDLKFNILVTDLSLAKQRLKLDPDDDPVEDIQQFKMDQIDPKRLLEDENILDKLNKNNK